MEATPQEVEFARLISNELDAALIEMGLVSAAACAPFDHFPQKESDAIVLAARRVLKKMPAHLRLLIPEGV
jgi:hypothetical protein